MSVHKKGSTHAKQPAKKKAKTKAKAKAKAQVAKAKPKKKVASSGAFNGGIKDIRTIKGKARGKRTTT